MRSSRFILLGLVAVALAGCMQSGGQGVFARNAPPLWKQNIAVPAMLLILVGAWLGSRSQSGHGEHGEGTGCTGKTLQGEWLRQP